MRLIAALLVAAGALSGAFAGRSAAAPAAQQALACDGSEGVYLYDGLNFSGRCIRITGDAPDLSAFTFNNAASSLRIIGTYTAVLYVDQNYGNLASAFGFDSPDLRGSVVDDNRASAARVIRGYRQSTDEICRGDGVYLYEGAGYTGRCVRYTGDEPDLGRQVFNNQASSVRIVGGYTAQLYVDQSYGGFEARLTQSLDDLNATAVGRQRASSIRVTQAGGPNACTGAAGVYLYEHPNFQGRCARLTSTVSDLRTIGFDDIASSVRLVGGYSATLFRDLSGTGISTSFSGDDANLADNPIGDNQATSVQVGGAPAGNACDGSEGAYLYEHPSFQGRCLRLTADAGDLRVYGFDDIASSVRLVGGYSATLFRDLSGTGISTAFGGDDANLADNPIGDNQATSVRVTRGGTPPPAGNACDGSEGAYLYEHPNYQGRCIRLTTGAGDLRAYGFDDTISSVRIVGPWTVTLWRDLAGSGVLTRFTASDPNVADDPIGDNQATSVAVARR